MKMWKKLLCTVLCLALACTALTGCSVTIGRKDPGAGDAAPAAPAHGTGGQKGAYQIGLIQFSEDPWLDSLREAFMSRLEEWEYDEEMVDIEYLNAKGDAASAERICKKFVAEGVNMIVALSTPAAKAAVEAAGNAGALVLFAGVTDPENDLGIRSLLATEGNVTGTADRSSVARTVDLALTVNPAMKTLGLLYDPTDDGAKAFVDEVRAYCELKEVQVTEATAHRAEEVSAAAAPLLEKTEAILTPADGVMNAAAAGLAESARKAKKPWYTGKDSLVQAGALASVSRDGVEMGYRTADMAVELMSGRPVSQVPVSEGDGLRTYLNMTTLEELGVQLPEEILSQASYFADPKAEAAASEAPAQESSAPAA